MKTINRFAASGVQTSAEVSKGHGPRLTQPGRPEPAADPVRIARAEKDDWQDRRRQKRRACIIAARQANRRDRERIIRELRDVHRRGLVNRISRRDAKFVKLRARSDRAVRCLDLPGRWWPDAVSVLRDASLNLPMSIATLKLAMRERRPCCGMRFYRGRMAPEFREARALNKAIAERLRAA